MKKKKKFVFGGWISLSPVFALRLELFTIFQPDISFSSLLDI